LPSTPAEAIVVVLVTTALVVSPATGPSSVPEHPLIAHAIDIAAASHGSLARNDTTRR
jgi:hypothetical protein